MIKIFLSYRREDSRGIAGRIFDRLVTRFGAGCAFMDVDNIPLGKDFRTHLQNAVGQCNIFVAVIGEHWLSCCDAQGTRRLDSPEDFVRIEVETALSQDIPVIPILAGHHKMPGPHELPNSLQALSFRNGLMLDLGVDFHYHVDRLIRGIEKLEGAAGNPYEPQTSATQTPRAKSAPSVPRPAASPEFPPRVPDTVPVTPKPKTSPGPGVPDQNRTTPTPSSKQPPATAAPKPTPPPSQTPAANAPKQQRSAAIRPWARWTTGAALVLLLGIVMVFTNPDGAPTVPLAGSKAGETREITLSGGVKLVQVWCPAGSFKMGSTEAQIDALLKSDSLLKREYFEHETPQVDVTLSQGFWLGQTEITQGQWQAVMGTTPWTGENYVQEGATYPATHVGWYDAVEFCNKLSASQQLTPCYRISNRQPATGSIDSATVEFLASGTGYRLPTEAQWEYACRAGTTGDYSFEGGESELSNYAWWGGLAGDGNCKNEQYAHIVGQKKPNPWGLFDMHGNVREWCQDCQTQLPGGSDPLVDGDIASTRRVLRGGSWDGNARGSRSAYRNRFAPDDRNGGNGFRVCVSVRTP